MINPEDPPPPKSVLVGILQAIKMAEADIEHAVKLGDVIDGCLGLEAAAESLEEIINNYNVPTPRTTKETADEQDRDRLSHH